MVDAPKSSNNIERLTKESDQIVKLAEERDDSIRTFDDRTIRIEMVFTKIKRGTITFKFPTKADDETQINYPQ